MNRIDYSKFSNYSLSECQTYIVNKHNNRVGKCNYTRLIDDDGVKRLVSLNRLIYYKIHNNIPKKSYIIVDEQGQLTSMSVKDHYLKTSKRHAISENVWNSCKNDLVGNMSIRSVSRKNNVSLSWLYSKLRKAKLENNHHDSN
jgi:hypothetical protein